MAPRPIRVCLIMHSTRSDNLGVGALTVSEVAILRRLAADLRREIEITVLDLMDRREPYVTGPDIRLVPYNRQAMTRPDGYFALARKSDFVIDIGAGDSFADIYGSGRLNRMFLLKGLTHLARTPLVMAPQTIGPFTKRSSKLAARLFLNRAAVVASRDRQSTKAAKDLGRRDVIEASDVALRLPYDPPAPREGGPVKVGINVSGLLLAGGYSGRNDFGLRTDYPGLIRDLIRHFQAHPAGCEVHLVSHVIVHTGRMTGEDDLRACQALAAEFPGTVLAPDFASPSEAKTYIAGLDFFMGARMHACIAAFSSGVPVVPMAYSRKFAGLFGSLGYDRTVDCTGEENAAILGKVAQAFEDRAAVKRETEAALALGIQKLAAYETALRRLMEAAPRA
ncbi:polysaccharide pyruvyl transferase family protein [Rubellimicrobium aerolatum]|uniref:Polysaccharide pyruvyl transferase family protein n=1 Tax=Rubellimicrobium aerolatum TaxID=490979 RepID=A0ABW0S9F6_9RHOB|nr:polysaccharide pyruvyl transferase family protein [Rubellimicrobium aerolatum]MBP1804927.1 polysaccharide pyruvyl transferase WcaK-like protein [Rubellimicrobium aerolatum]